MKTTQSHRVITDFIKQRYGSIARQGTSRGCCNGGCSCSSSTTDIDQISATLGYRENDLDEGTAGANLGLGCGNPLAHASIKEGEVVLDLGSGGGFDCFLARRQVGEHGRVLGVDMTPRMIELARTNASKLGYANVEFVEGAIEALPVPDDSIDVIISNCVINLSLDKARVFREAFRVLKPGGRLAVSDVVATAELPDVIKQDLKLFAGCVAGAEHVEMIEKLLRNSGFTEIKLTPKDTSKEILSSWMPGTDIDQYVASYIIEAIKPM
jgi:SAM-dependent methyltransferase